MLIRLLMLPVLGALVIGGVFLVAMIFGLWNHYQYDQRWRAADVAAVASKANVDLIAAVNGDSNIQALLGPPLSVSRPAGVANGQDESWFHDDAVTAQFVTGDTGAGIIDLAFARRTAYDDGPAFRGSFMGLRLGDPPPAPDAAAALRAKARDCCDIEDVVWTVADNRIVAVDVHWAVEYTPAPRS